MKKPTRTHANRPGHLRIAKSIRREVADMKRAGWTITTGGRHAMITCPAGVHALPIPQKDTGVIAAFRVHIRRHNETCGQ